MIVLVELICCSNRIVFQIININLNYGKITRHSNQAINSRTIGYC